MGPPTAEAPLFAAARDPSAPVARLALPIAVDELFDYAVPAELDLSAQPGCRARVRFGRRRLVGVVVERAAEARFAGKLRPLEAVLDPEPAIPASLLAVVREEAAEILCPVGIALAAAAPAGSAPRLARAYALTETGRAALEGGELAAEERAALERLAKRSVSGATLRRHGATAELLRSLERRRLVSSEAVEPKRRAGTRAKATARPRPPVDRDEPPALTSEQAKALDEIAGAVRAREARTFLLHGVTGSGKTEVYLRAIAEARAAGRQALVLVPEITLTHQIVARVRARFGDAVAVLHSGLRPRERLEQWRRLRDGSTPIAVGARSALFAPLERLGVIAIDEEHDGAYKNEEGFRYHARELAARRALHTRCPLVLGSATPSIETRFAADRGEIRRLPLPFRIGGRPLPAVEIVDLEEERRLLPRGRKLVFSRALARALTENLARGGQAILLLNRRGFSTRIFCFACGHAERCANCDVALVFHAQDGCLRCHYCDHRRAPPAVCAGCGAPDSALLGLGTERIEEELRRLLPSARIARLDRDTAARRGFGERVLAELRDGRLDVVVGTQIVAKGHDFPGVRLVGVVLADVGLHLPDFRAAERTFQLLTQVAGRAGRDAHPGRVIVQTFSPRHYAIRPVAEHDYEAFYAEELGHRAPLGYPPFGHLAHALVAGPDEERTREAASRLAAAARAAGGAVEVLGPAPAPLSRLRGRYRQQVLLKGAERAALREAARALAAAAAGLPSRVRAVVDLRPLDML
jgi:primosomal protein N' (replication factor Y)